MSILELFDNHSTELDHGLIDVTELDHDLIDVTGLEHDLIDVDLNLFEETVVQDIMTEVSVPMTIEEEISELQLTGLLDLSDHSDLPCMPGIQATDVGSLLEQFEEVSQTLADCDSLEPTFDHSNSSELPININEEKADTPKEKKEMTAEMLERFKSNQTKRKTAVMLPMGVPAKRGRGRAMPRGRPVGIPANCTPLCLQRVMMQNKELNECLPNVTPETLTEIKERPKDDVLKANENYFEWFDHDYCKPQPDFSTNVKNKTAEAKENINNATREETNAKDNGVKFGLCDETNEEGEIVENATCDNSKFLLNAKSDSWSKRNYRKQRAESPMIESRQLFDKIPTYYTALSIPKKPMRRSASDSLKPGICFQDFLERDVSPARDTSAYSKLPDYYSTFTNSMKYDKPDKNGNYSQDSKTSSGYSSRSQSPLVIDSRQNSPSRSPSYVSSRHKHDRSLSSRHDRSLSKKRHNRSLSRSCDRSKSRRCERSESKMSYSSGSRYSRSPSSSSSCSRSCSKSCSRSCSMSCSRSCSRSCSKSCSRSCSVESFSNRSRSSSMSSCSSSGSSRSSRSRSRSVDRDWRRERDMREIRSRRRRSITFSRFSISRSRSRSRSRRRNIYRHRSPSFSRSRSRPFRSRSRSRSYSRRRDYRSRSRSYSRCRDGRRNGYRDYTREREREMERQEREMERKQLQELRKKEKEDEKRQQNAERRIIYVGCIPDHYTRRKLHHRFEKFGEIEQVQLHFREHGDNYGFVTFAYTCDAYAAIEKGNLGLKDDVKFDLCFGGRRQFCDEVYADLDGNKEIEEEFDTAPRKGGPVDFDELLRQARSKIKKS